MRVLVIAHGFPPHAQGGSEIYAHDHARTLARLFGDEVLVLTRENDTSVSEFNLRSEQRDGMSIAWINNTFATARTFEDTYRNPRIAAIAGDVIDRFKPDVAHIHHLTCLSTTIIDELARRGIPIVFTLHDYWLMCHRGQLLDTDYRVCHGPAACHGCIGPSARPLGVVSSAAPIVRRIARSLPEGVAATVQSSALRMAAGISSPSESVDQESRRLAHMKQLCTQVSAFYAPSRHLRERFLAFGIENERIAFSPYGFDAAPFRARIAPPHHERLRIGFMGTLMVSKAPHVLLEAFRRLPAGDASVDLLGRYSPYHGDDSYRHTLQPLLELPGVRLHHPVAHEDVAPFLESIDVLVVPSIWPENSPLVIGEAFLAGVPVVAANIGGIPEAVVDGVNGLLFEPGDPVDLHRALKRLIDEPRLLTRLRNGIGKVRTIEDDVMWTRGEYERVQARTSTKKVGPLAAVVLNYRTTENTLIAVKSLAASRRALDEIIVVDNAATPSLRLALEQLDIPATYLPIDCNVGFSAGVNHGIRHALTRGADRVLLVNSDMYVPPDCVERLEQGMDRSPNAGIAGPVVLSRCDPERVASQGMTYAPSTGRMRHRGAHTCAASIDRMTNVTVDGISGCLMLINRAVFDAIGLFDEDYFFSFEDLDFCLKAKGAGFSTLVVSGATAYHEGGQSIGQESAERLYFASRNHLLLALRHRSAGPSLRSAVLLSAIVALNVAHAARARGGPLPTRLAAVARGTRDYFSGRFGAGSADL